jgi:hypothetical protein
VSGRDDKTTTAGSTPPEPTGSPMSRRSLLGAAGAGAAGLTAATLISGPALASARPGRQTTPAVKAEPAGTQADGAIVAHVRDTRSGDIDIFSGTTHTRIRDPQLAALLARTAR